MFHERTMGWRGRSREVAKTAVALLAFPAWATTTAYAGTVVYVDDDGPLGGDGQSWQTAFINLQDAMVDLSDGDEIRVAQGTYWPDRGGGREKGDREASFDLLDGVSLLGGFAGLGAPDPDERDPEAFITVLTGEIGDPDVRTDNSAHVVLCPSRRGPTTVLDGVTVTRGQSFNHGGGIWIESQSDPTITDCVFVDNWSVGHGGGMRCRGLPTIRGCRFIDNHAELRGGGAYVLSSGSVLFEDCLFKDNSAQSLGGGLDADGSTIVDCVFEGNLADHGGGVATNVLRIERSVFRDNTAMRTGGGIFALSGFAGTVVDCTFVDNTALCGGGLKVEGSSEMSFLNCVFLGNTASFEGGGAMTNGGNITFANCVFSGNTTDGAGGAVQAWRGVFVNSSFSENSAMTEGGGLSASDDMTIANCILWNNDVDGVQDEAAQLQAEGVITIDYSCVESWTGGLGGAGNIGADPQFTDPIGPDEVPGTLDDDLRLLPKSPCIDAGNNWGVRRDDADLDDDGDTQELTPLDLDRSPRFADAPLEDTGCGVPVIVDMGAFEFPGDHPESVRLGDIDGDGVVAFADLLGLLALWGPCVAECCLADLDLSGDVGFQDLLTLIANWS